MSNVAMRTAAAVIIIAIIIIVTLVMKNSPRLDFHKMFGPQTSEFGIFRSSPDKALDTYDAELRVVSGARATLEKSENRIVSCVSGEVVAVTEPRFDPASMYVVGKVVLREKTGRRVYVYVLKVTSGALKGARIKLTDGRMPSSVTAPYQGFFKLPSHLNLPEGPLDFKVVEWAKK